MGLNELSTILWRERNLLELLLFKLETQELLVASGRTRWLAHAAREVEAVLERVREAELVRSMEVDAIAPSLLLAPGASLREMAAVAPAPWGGMFEEHRVAFLVLTDAVAAATTANREQLSRGARLIDETISKLVERDEESGYGFRDRSNRHGAVLDEAL